MKAGSKPVAPCVDCGTLAGTPITGHLRPRRVHGRCNTCYFRSRYVPKPRVYGDDPPARAGTLAQGAVNAAGTFRLTAPISYAETLAYPVRVQIPYTYPNRAFPVVLQSDQIATYNAMCERAA